ncbi:hypothetical protein B0H14DRAFT_2751233 [Mycena olivaceomarginata]|nr:hypothetical protein B0H14DRAFT_2751233 [Mycena olivaceomarginata]
MSATFFFCPSAFFACHLTNAKVCMVTDKAITQISRGGEGGRLLVCIALLGTTCACDPSEMRSPAYKFSTSGHSVHESEGERERRENRPDFEIPRFLARHRFYSSDCALCCATRPEEMQRLEQV